MPTSSTERTNAKGGHLGIYQLGVKATVDGDDEEIGYFQFNLCSPRDPVAGLPWYEGTSFPAMDGPVCLRVDDLGGWAGAFPDYWSGPVPLASQRLRTAIESAGVDNVQWFATRIEPREGLNVPVFFAFNIVGIVSASDATASKGVRFFNAPGADLFERLVLRGEAVTGLHLFRLAESMSTILLSERVKSAIESAGIQTVSFELLSQT